MKIAYIVSSDIARFKGSTGKIKSQIDVWRKLGHQVEAFCLTPDAEPSILSCRRFIKDKSLVKDKLFLNRDLNQALLEYNPEVVYIRYALPSRTFLQLQKVFKTILEINTDDQREYFHFFLDRKGLKDLLLALSNALLRRRFLGKAAGLVTVTRELMESKAFSRYNKNRTCIPNSVILPEDPIKGRARFPTKGKIELFFIGSPGESWHGIDKLVRIAEIFQEHFNVHIVGSGRPPGESERANVFYYGYLDSAGYEMIMERCHICIGTLSFHKIKIKEACTLKVREYLKHGFPVALAYKETAFLENPKPWLLELPNSEALVSDKESMQKLLHFCEANRNYVVTPEEVAPYIDSYRLEEQRLAFIASSL